MAHYGYRSLPVLKTLRLGGKKQREIFIRPDEFPPLWQRRQGSLSQRELLFVRRFRELKRIEKLCGARAIRERSAACGHYRRVCIPHAQVSDTPRIKGVPLVRIAPGVIETEIGQGPFFEHLPVVGFDLFERRGAYVLQC